MPGVDARVDTLLGMVMQLMSEVSVLRERVDALSASRPRRSPPPRRPPIDYVPDGGPLQGARRGAQRG